MVLQPATDDTEDARVIFTVSKNNDGELGAQTAWERGVIAFEKVDNFDWAAYAGEGAPPVEKVTEAHLRKLFNGGQISMQLAHAAKQLMELAGVGRTTAYAALKFIGGKFSHLLVSENGLITIRPQIATEEGGEQDSAF